MLKVHLAPHIRAVSLQDNSHALHQQNDQAWTQTGHWQPSRSSWHRIWGQTMMTRATVSATDLIIQLFTLCYTNIPDNNPKEKKQEWAGSKVSQPAPDLWEARLRSSKWSQETSATNFLYNSRALTWSTKSPWIVGLVTQTRTQEVCFEMDNTWMKIHWDNNVNFSFGDSCYQMNYNWELACSIS